MNRTAYGDDALSRTTTHMCFKWFKEGRDSIEDEKGVVDHQHSAWNKTSLQSAHSSH